MVFSSISHKLPHMSNTDNSLEVGLLGNSKYILPFSGCQTTLFVMLLVFKATAELGKGVWNRASENAIMLAVLIEIVIFLG